MSAGDRRAAATWILAGHPFRRLRCQVHRRGPDVADPAERRTGEDAEVDPLDVSASSKSSFVGTIPGAIAFTLMSGASSTAIVWVSEITAALHAA
jgi:hypothetical protein